MQDKIYLRPLCLNDVSEKYLSWVNDPSVTEYLEIGRQYLKHQDLVKYVKDSPKNGRYNFAIITKNSKHHIGNCSIFSINPENKNFEIGWFIGDKNFWGGHYSPMIIFYLLKIGFLKMGLEKCTGYVDKKNTEVSYWLPSKFFRGAYSKGWHTPHPGFFATKDCYTEIAKFDESMKIAADFDLMARLMENTNVGSFHMEKIVVDMRVGGLSSTLKGRLLGFVEIYKSLKKQKLVLNTGQYFYFRYLNKILKRF